jgi:hypothetical protein
MLNKDIFLKPSLFLISLIVIQMAIMTIAILFSSIDLLWQVILMVLTMGYGFFILWTYGFLKSQQSVIAVRLLTNGTWILFTHTQVITGELLTNSTVTKICMVLRFKIEKSWWKKSVVIFKDSTGAYVDLYRQIYFGR